MANEIYRDNTWRHRLARLLLVVVRLLVYLPRPVLVSLLAVAEWFARRTGADDAALAPLIEIKEIFRDDPKGRAALRRMLWKGRTSQLVSFMAGVGRHYMVKRPDPLASFAVSGVNDQHPAPKRGRIAFLGKHFEFEHLRKAYLACGDCDLVEENAPPLALLNQVDAAEIALSGPESEEWVNAALAKGVAVSLHIGQAPADRVANVCGKAAQYGTPLRVFYPYLYYEPVRRVKALVADGVIGEPGTLRVRATLGAAGARRLEPPFGDEPLRHPAFDHFALLTFFGGPAAQLSAYVQPMDPERGGQATVAVGYRDAGRYGLLECTWAPGLHLRSEFYPHDLAAELSGTDGIIWLRRGMAARTTQAPIAVRVGMSAYTIGVESGLREDWAGVYETAAAEMLELIGGRITCLIKPDELITARRLADRVYDAAQTPGVLAL